MYIDMNDVLRMRQQFIPAWINRHYPQIHNEIYHPGRHYDVVVFLKSMESASCREAQKIMRYGGKVVFDANVNYYEVWGDYFVAGTKPTVSQRQCAIWMTSNADWVVADSTYLEGVARTFTDRVCCIPDNVNLDIYRWLRCHRQENAIRIVWCGVAKKADHLRLITDVLKRLRERISCELLLVAERPPQIMHLLSRAIPCAYRPFRSDACYARLLARCDIIISPKDLCNAYEMGHSEYKITLGMAAGLPAVASPQQSYIEALSHHGGVVARNPEEWFDALYSLCEDVSLRKRCGAQARHTVERYYSTPVIARRYAELLLKIAGSS